MDPNQAVEARKPQEVVKPAEATKENSVQQKFEKAKGRFGSTVSVIREAFGKLKAQSPQINFGPEQWELDQSSEELDRLNQETQQQLVGTPNPPESQEDQPLTGAERTTKKPEELGQMEEKKSFQKDITDLLLSTSGGTPSLDLFLSRYPQYRKYNLEYLAKNVPEYVKFSPNRSHPLDSTIDVSLKAFRKFLYRGEHGDNLSTAENILNLIELVDKQGGIGGTAENLTHVSPNPYVSLDFAIWGGTSPEGFGIWMIDSKIPKELKVVKSSDRERVIRGLIPLKYVNKLFVTKDMEEKILQRYGVENTQLFGKPIKDVITGIDPILERPPASNATNPNQISSLIETIYKLNVQSTK